MSENSKKKQPNGPSKNISNAAKFSGIAVKMAAIIGIFTWIGVWADEKLSLSTPICTIVLSLTGVFVSLYSLINDLKENDKE